MTKLTAEAVLRIVGSADEDLVTRILDTGASEADLMAAVAWVEQDDAMGETSDMRATGIVARLCTILQEAKELPEDEPS